MLGKLYKITFIGSSKVYVGKTYSDLNSRFYDHKKNSIKFPNRKLSKAFNKYGLDNASIHLIAEFEEGILEQKEVEYISNYNSYINGYNSTLGGDGSRYLTISDKEIIDTFIDVASTARKLNIDFKTVKTILHNYNIKTGSINDPKLSRRKPVYCVELNELFASAEELAKVFIDAELTSASLQEVRKSINKAASGARKSYLGFTIKYSCSVVDNASVF